MHSIHLCILVSMQKFVINYYNIPKNLAHMHSYKRQCYLLTMPSSWVVINIPLLSGSYLERISMIRGFVGSTRRIFSIQPLSHCNSPLEICSILPRSYKIKGCCHRRFKDNKVLDMLVHVHVTCWCLESYGHACTHTGSYQVLKAVIR